MVWLSARRASLGDPERWLAGPGDRRAVRRAGAGAQIVLAIQLARGALGENDPDLCPSGSESGEQRPSDSGCPVPPLHLRHTGASVSRAPTAISASDGRSETCLTDQG